MSSRAFATNGERFDDRLSVSVLTLPLDCNSATVAEKPQNYAGFDTVNRCNGGATAAQQSNTFDMADVA